MAGTVQSLILTHPFPNPTPLHHRLRPHYSCKHSLLYSRSVSVNNNRPVFGPVKACGASDQTSGNGVNKANTGNGFTWLRPLSNFAANNFLPLALVCGVALGFANPTLGCVADSYNLSKFSTFGIFLISGLTLKSAEIGGAVEAWPVGIYGLASILLFTPYFSRLMLQIQLQPQEFVTGLAIFCCMPTTLSSGVALTQLAKGNTALALMMTVISNMLGILAVPFSISKFIADGIGVSVPTKQLFRSLILTLLVPLILGKISRESFKGVANLVDQNSRLFSRSSAIFLSLVRTIYIFSSPLNNSLGKGLVLVGFFVITQLLVVLNAILLTSKL